MFVRSQKYFFIFLLVFGFEAFPAAGSPKNYDRYSTQSGSLSWMDVSIGILGLSSLSSRGATFYDKPALYPYISINYLDGLIESGARGTTLNYQANEKTRLRAGIKMLFDDAFFTGIYGEQEPHRSSRSFGLEGTLGISYSLFDSLTVDMSFNQGILGHGGIQSETSVYYSFLTVLKEYKPAAIFSLGGTIGYGTSRHNQYLYGPTANASGFNYYSTSITTILPELLPRISPILVFVRSEILGQSTRHASLVSDKPTNWSVLLILPYKLDI